MKKGFTLAEVLITIAIIGVVAVLTVPVLVQNYKKQVATTRLKNFYSTMQQAIALSEIENNSVEMWQRAEGGIRDEEGGYDYNANAQACHDFFMTYLAPYMNYQKAVQTPEKESTDDEFSVYWADGSLMKMHNGACVDLYYDVNGDAKPNEYGRDKFNFGICVKKSTRSLVGGKSFGALYFLWNSVAPNREKALASCKSNSFVCGALLMFDNWEFKDDYPHKL